MGVKTTAIGLKHAVLTTMYSQEPPIKLLVGKGVLTDEQKADLSREVTDLIVKETKQPQHYTWVIIHDVAVENWMIDRLTLPELKAKLMAEKK